MIPLATLFADHQLYHSDFQMDSLITVRAGGTKYGCYKQSLRELWKRYRGLRDLYLQHEMLVIDIDELSTRRCDNQFDRRRATVQLASKKLSLAEAEKSIADTEREFLRFYCQSVSLKEAIGELDEDRRATLDFEMWEHRVKCAVAVDFVSTGRLNSTTIELLHAFPVESRRQLAEDLINPSRRNELIDWYFSHSPDVPAVEPLQITDVRRLIDS